MFGSLWDKKDREWEGEKKTLVKNLSAIDFSPCWSSTYHPTSHCPVFFSFFSLLLLLESFMFHVQFFCSQVNKEVVWQSGGVPGWGGAWGVARFLHEGSEATLLCDVSWWDDGLWTGAAHQTKSSIKSVKWQTKVKKRLKKGKGITPIKN